MMLRRLTTSINNIEKSTTLIPTLVLSNQNKLFIDDKGTPENNLRLNLQSGRLTCKYKPPQSAQCRGDWLLGTASGRCQRCLDTAKVTIDALRDERDRFKSLITLVRRNASRC